MIPPGGKRGGSGAPLPRGRFPRRRRRRMPTPSAPYSLLERGQQRQRGDRRQLPDVDLAQLLERRSPRARRRASNCPSFGDLPLLAGESSAAPARRTPAPRGWRGSRWRGSITASGRPASRPRGGRSDLSALPGTTRRRKTTRSSHSLTAIVRLTTPRQQRRRELRELVVVGGEERAAARARRSCRCSTIAQASDSPSKVAVPRPDLVEDHQALRGRVAQDVRRSRSSRP